MKKLNTLVADLAVFNTKLHNVHWNVVGSKFVEIHNFTEDLYTKLFETYDEVAELIKMKGEFPHASLKAYMENTTLEELPNQKISTEEALNIVLNDLKAINKLSLEIREEAEEEFEISNLMEDIITENNKQIWFLNSITDKK